MSRDSAVEDMIRKREEIAKEQKEYELDVFKVEFILKCIEMQKDDPSTIDVRPWLARVPEQHMELAQKAAVYAVGQVTYLPATAETLAIFAKGVASFVEVALYVGKWKGALDMSRVYGVKL